ncbi:MAG: CHASE4 domain-containing protein [Woeseiaceae bacterium]
MQHPIASLSLQQKMSATLLTVMATLAVLSYLILRATVQPAFSNLELSAADTNLVRAKRALQSDLENLAAIVGDWAPWDESYSYALGENPGFVKSNLDLLTFLNLDLDLMLMYDNDANLIWGQMIRDGDIADPAALGIFNDRVVEKLRAHTGLESRIEGFVPTALGPMLVSSQPIATSNHEGPIVGTMIMAQFFDAERLDSLRARTEVMLDWYPAGEQSAVPSSVQALIAAADPETTQYATTDRTIEAYALLTDLFGKPLLILKATTPRSISSLGASTVKGALLSLSIAGIIVAVVTWLLLRRIIVLPLQQLARHITGIRESGDLSLRLNTHRHDEIGALSNEFDQMTKEVQDARRLLLEQSFKAGKADTAAEVLHNIRNAMTPLINGIDRISKSFKTAGGLRVQQATEELADPNCPAERREKLLRYLASAFGHVQTTGENAIRDLQIASKQAHQVEAILSDQEKFANVPPVIENLELDEVVEEAALVLPDADKNRIRLDVQRGLERFRVRAHRIGLLQVLGNLILNAYEAIQRSQVQTGNIEVLASVEQIDDQSMVRVTIRDSGCGFDEDVGKRIFHRGFSSKSGKLSGLGLHWCANSVAGMGGRILADSTGPGRGAEFHVLLPAA